MSNLNILENYLENSNLLDSLVLTKNVSFHWSNWDQTCLFQRKLNRRFQNESQLLMLNAELLKLKQKEIWLCNTTKVIKSDLYSLYESYLDSRLRITWFDRKEDILFSEKNENGPFYSVTSMKWLDKEIYSKFVYRKILTDFCTLRSFRLNTAFPLDLKFNSDVYIFGNHVLIHQISESGIILKFKDRTLFRKWNDSKHINLKFKASLFQEILPQLKNDEKIHDIQIDSKIINLYGNSQNFKRTSDNEFYVFVKYSDFSCSEKSKKVFDSLKAYVKQTKDSLNCDIEKIKLAG